MELKTISPCLSVSPQIMPEDIAAIASDGFRAIICNRPDGECADQASFADIKAAAESVGLNSHYIPVQPGKISDDDVATFADALRSADGPILAYCRTGTRSAMLWSLSEAGKQPASDILAATLAAGYDLSAVAERIANAEKTRKVPA
ncbi:MAG: TIGR01244 family sulfur transferase [Pseudomonadota bacterium]